MPTQNTATADEYRALGKSRFALRMHNKCTVHFTLHTMRKRGERTTATHIG